MHMHKRLSNCVGCGLVAYQVFSEGLKSFLCLLNLFRRALQNYLVCVGVKLHMNLGEVLCDLLHILTLTSNDEAMEPLRGVDFLYSNTVGLFIYLNV